MADKNETWTKTKQFAEIRTDERFEHLNILLATQKFVQRTSGARLRVDRQAVRDEVMLLSMQIVAEAHGIPIDIESLIRE